MQNFHVKLPTLWRQVFPALVLGAAAGRALRWMEGQPFNRPDTLPMMGIAAVMVLAMHFFQPTQAGEGGLHVMNTWGIRRKLSWADVESVVFARLFWVQPSLRLQDHRGRHYWIATDTKNLSGLHELAARHGGADHPLTRALETPMYRL